MEISAEKHGSSKETAREARGLVGHYGEHEHQRLGGRAPPPPPGQCSPRILFCSKGDAERSHEEKRRMESCIRISLSEYIDPDQSQRFDHSGRNEIWREPFPPARTCDTEPAPPTSDDHPRRKCRTPQCRAVVMTVFSDGPRRHLRRPKPRPAHVDWQPRKILFLTSLF